MSRASRILISIAVVAVALFGVLVVMSLFWLRPEGLGNFDGRLLGYDVDAARAYLSALSDQGRALYLGPFRWVDTVFPILVACAIGGTIWRTALGFPVAQRIAMLGVVVAYLVVDLSENAFVAQMLRSVGPVSAELADRASDMTQMKWALFAASLVLLDVLRRRNKTGSV